MLAAELMHIKITLTYPCQWSLLLAVNVSLKLRRKGVHVEVEDVGSKSGVLYPESSR